ncbi:hypothetical protein NN561_013674 [Cricetulus griseus]
MPSAAPVPAVRTLTPFCPESRWRPPQPPARAPPPQRGQQPRAFTASGLGRAHRCARPFPPPPGPRVAAAVAARLLVPGHCPVDAATGEELAAGRSSPRVAAGPRDLGHEQVCASTNTRSLLQRNLCVSCSSQAS